MPASPVQAPADREVADRQLAEQPAGVRHGSRQVGQAPAGASREPGAGDPQGQRQACARRRRWRRRRQARPPPRRFPAILPSSADGLVHAQPGHAEACSRPPGPPARELLVTRTADPAVPGSRGRTWAAVAASSASTSTRRPASTERYKAARSASPAGTLPAGHAERSEQLAQHVQWLRGPGCGRRGREQLAVRERARWPDGPP